MNTDWVISGVGLVSAVGDTPAGLHAAMCAGMPLRRPLRDPASPEDAPEPRFPTVPMTDFQISNYIQSRGLKDLSRTSQLACAAASFPARDLERMEPDRAGIVLGCGWGSIRSIVDFE